MRKLFSLSGRAALRTFMERNPLLVFDFDGTLAQLQPHPNAVRLSRGTRSLLLGIAHHSPLAIVSGRSNRDLRHFFPQSPCILIGNHGIEGGTAAPAELKRAKSVCRAWRTFIERNLHQVSRGAQCWLEDKTYSLTIHCHGAAALRTVVRLLRTAVHHLPPVRMLPGKASVNLIVEPWNKGMALRCLLKKTGRSCALFVGDDATDEDVLTLPRTQVFFIRVGNVARSRAQLVLRSQRWVGTLLREIEHSLRGRQG